MPSTPSNPREWIGRILGKTYRIERLIGEGGMGVVYEASHLRLKRRFALKFLSGGLTDQRMQNRFRREAEVTSRLHHPNIVEVVDYNVTEDGVPYIAMGLLEGTDLAARLAQKGPIDDFRWIAAVLRQTTEALKFAHQHGVVHRDLKPRNLFLCQMGSLQDVVKVLDFGISKVAGARTELTSAGAIIGTYCYMAPEQIDGSSQEVDPRTDIYALGVILYEMLSGRRPFEATTIPALLYKVVHQDPTDIANVCPGLPPAIRSVIARAIAKNRDDRHASVEAFWLDAHAALDGTASSSHPHRDDRLPNVHDRQSIIANDADDGRAETGAETTLPTGRRPARIVMWSIIVATSVCLGAIGLFVISPGSPTVPPASSDDKRAAPQNVEPQTVTLQKVTEAVAPPYETPAKDVAQPNPNKTNDESSNDSQLDSGSRNKTKRRTRHKAKARPATSITPSTSPSVGNLSLQAVMHNASDEEQVVFTRVLISGNGINKLLESGTTIRDLPTGTYTLKSTHPQYELVTREVTIESGKQTVVKFVLKRIAQ